MCVSQIAKGEIAFVSYLVGQLAGRASAQKKERKEIEKYCTLDVPLFWK